MQTRRTFMGRTLAGAAGLGIAQVPWMARAQTPPSWAVPELVAAAKTESGKLVVYASVNEQEALPFWKPFEQATGITLEYVRGSDAQLMGRIGIENRTGQRTWDLLSATGMGRVPTELLQPCDPPEAKFLIPQAQDKERKVYGIFSNYNTPAYNTKLIDPADLPKSYEAFAAKTAWTGKTANDVNDTQWLAGLFKHYGEANGRKLLTEMVANLKPSIIDGHLALARQVGAGEYAVAFNNYLALTMNVRLSGAPTDFWVLDPVVLFFHQVGLSAKAPNPKTGLLAMNYILSKEGQSLATKWGRIPVRTDVATNPADIAQKLAGHKIVAVNLNTEEERNYRRIYDEIFRKKG